MKRAIARVSLVLLAVVAVCTVAVPAQAAKIYVDTKLGELSPDQRIKIAEPRPVQLLFQFTTDGAPNAKATKFLKEQVFALAKASGLFSEVSELPVAGGATLVITFDNITEKGAAGKGFTAGLTFGLAGALVADNYLIKAEYQGGAGAAPVAAEVRHCIYAKIGNKEPPADAVQVKNAKVAIETVTRQSIDHVINGLAANAGFAGSPTTPAEPAAPAAPAAPATPGA